MSTIQRVVVQRFAAARSAGNYHSIPKTMSERRNSTSSSSSSDNNNGSNEDEYQYLRLIRRILDKPITRPNRTGIDTYSIFGTQMRFNLRNGILPLLTTKRVFWRGVLEEMLWFIRGSTNAYELSAKGVKIWEANGSRPYLDSLGFHSREEGDLGPVYGFQWRHFGARYRNMHFDYKNEGGVDQLQNVIQKLKHDPNDRRIVMSAWNPCDIPSMALPPCHVLVQFYVERDELSAQLYQRSADMGLGVPFNIASYSLLVHMIAHLTNLKPGEFVHTMGDCHVYKNHVDALEQQLRREPRPFPTLSIKRQVTDIDDFRTDDFEVIGYDPYPNVPMKMAL